MIRDEYASLQKGKHEESELQDSLQKILMDDKVDFDYTADTPSLKEGIIDRINEYMTELETRLLTQYKIINYSVCSNKPPYHFLFQCNRYISSSTRTHPC